MHTNTIPAALARTGSRILAAGSQTPEALFRDLNAAVTGHIDRHNEQITNLEAALQAVQAHGGAGGGPSHILPVEPDYTRAFASYFRKGNGEDVIKAVDASGERAPSTRQCRWATIAPAAVRYPPSPSPHPKARSASDRSRRREE